MYQKPIPSLLATLLERLTGQEALDLEFKSARNALPASLWPTISAFANTAGGWLVLGVGEQQGAATIEGVSNATTLLQDLHNLLRNPQKISHAVCGADDASIETLAGKQLLVLRVAAASRKARPVYVAGNPYTGTYLRRNSGDYHCTKAEVDRMMREASDIAADSAVLCHFNWADLDLAALARYRRRYQTQNPISPWNSYDDHAFLRALGGYGRDRETGVAGITVAGLLLLGQAEALREWRTRHLIDYRLVLSESVADLRWDDRVTWEGNLYEAFEAIYPRLIAGLPVPFRLQGTVRLDESQVHIALREALVNLLVHADYGETQASLIVRSPDGLLFRNPGSSRVPATDFLMGDRSDPRNPELVKMFRLVGLAEEAGTGIPKIISAWRELGFQLPGIDVGTERYEFTLQLRYAHLLSADDRTWLYSLGESWSEAEQLALVLAKHEGAVDNIRLRSLTGQHSSDITKVLGNLRDRDLLDMSGSGRSARYQLSRRVLETAGSPVATDSSPTTFTPFDFTELGGNSTSKVANFPGISANSPDKPANSPGMTDEDHAVWRDLQEIARPARRQTRLLATIRDDIIISLCRRIPLSLTDIAQLMNRNATYLGDILKSLITTGRLAYLYPEQPNHPQQKYVAVQQSHDSS
ncbi:MAG: putative DNA binding domain-containing protein [Chloroflexota bacterium]|nr:putative DNA binding domain-containing protein [Chloroflexota bacterium]